LRDADRWLYIPLMQDETPNSVEVPVERLRRVEAAAYARKRLGQSVKVNTLRTWPIRYRQIGRDAVYEIADLDAFIDQRLAVAPLRRAGPAPDFAAMFEERRRLLAGNGSEEEARLRSFEFVVNAHRAHFGADLETSKRAVTSALAEAAKLKA
jgi:hypothetical protein